MKEDNIPLKKFKKKDLCVGMDVSINGEMYTVEKITRYVQDFIDEGYSNTEIENELKSELFFRGFTQRQTNLLLSFYSEDLQPVAMRTKPIEKITFRGKVIFQRDN